MFDLLSIPLPWYLVGPQMGLSVAGLYAVANKHLGVTGAYFEVVALTRRRPVRSWRLWFLGGTFVGAVVVALLGGSSQTGLEYGALGDYLSLPALIATLFAGGALIGFGA